MIKNLKVSNEIFSSMIPGGTIEPLLFDLGIPDEITDHMSCDFSPYEIIS